MQTELLLLVILKALAELAFMFLLGRGALYVLAGSKREGNIFYGVLRVVTDPVIRAARWLTPRLVLDCPHPVRRRGARRLDLAGDRVLGPAGDVRLGLRLHGTSREQAMREPLLHFWAQTLLFFGRNARALRVMQEVVRENPARHEAWSVIGFLHAQSGELSQAIPALEKALALQPDDAALAFNAAFVLQRSGDHERAMALMQRAITLDPKLDRAWYGLGLSLAHVGRYEEAVTKFRQAARLQPFNPYAGYQLGAVLAKLGRREELLAEYERVKDFDPKVSGLMRREFGIEDPDAR